MNQTNIAFNDKFDVGIIGAGLAGLFTAAILAKRGLKVIVYETHDKPGGFATNFSRKKFKMEAGIHIHAGNIPGSVADDVLKNLKIEENVRFLKLETFYACHFRDQTFEVPANLKEAKLKIQKKFPRENKGVELFFSTMEEMCQEFQVFSERKPFVDFDHPIFPLLFPKLYSFLNTSIGHFVDSIVEDEFLKAILLANVGFYHDDRYSLSLLMFMISQGSYYLGGCYYTQGGSQEISNWLVKIIEENDGQVKLNTRVVELVCRGNIVQKIKALCKGDESVAEVKFCVANSPAPSIKNLINDESSLKSSMLKKFEMWKTSTSASMLYLGLNRKLITPNSAAYLNVYIEPKWGKNSQFGFDHFALLNYSSIESKMSPQEKGTCEIMFMDKYANWKSLEHEEYLKRKIAIKEELIRRIQLYIPNFSELIEVSDLGTPLTIERYTNSKHGGIYGYDPSPEGFKSRSFLYSKFSGSRDDFYHNLYYGSAWSYLPGFTGVTIAGNKVANEILIAMDKP